MSTTSPPASVAVLDSAVTWTHSCLQLARTSDLTLPTPCSAWNLGDLLAHMEDSLEALGEAAEVGRIRVTDLAGLQDPGRTIDRLVQRACTMRAAWLHRLTSAPISVGDLALGRDTLAMVGALEITVHGWDVARRSASTDPSPRTWPPGSIPWRWSWSPRRSGGPGSPRPCRCLRVPRPGCGCWGTWGGLGRAGGFPGRPGKLEPGWQYFGPPPPELPASPARFLPYAEPGPGALRIETTLDRHPSARQSGAMARMRGIAERVEHLLGQAVVATTPVAGGDICTSTRVRLSDGSSALVKTRAGAPEGFFETEARGLRWLAEPGAVDVAEVLAVEHECLVLRWIEPARPTAETASALGRSLARLHASGAEQFGAEEDGFIASLPLPNKTAPTWPEFYATRRVLPYLKLAADRGHVETADVETIEGVVGKIVEHRRPGRAAGPAARRPVVGQRRVVRRARHPHRPRCPRRPPGDRSRHARALRSPSPAKAGRRLSRRAPPRRRVGGAPAAAPAVPPARARRPLRRALRSPRRRGRRAALRGTGLSHCSAVSGTLVP